MLLEVWKVEPSAQHNEKQNKGRENFQRDAVCTQVSGKT